MDFTLICEQLYAVTHIPLSIASSDGACLASFPAMSKGSVNPHHLQFVLMDFALQKRDAIHPLITYVNPGYFIGVMALDADRYCVVGMVSPFSHSREEILNMVAYTIAPAELQSFCDLMMQMPRVNLYQHKALLQLLGRLIHGADINDEDILFVDNTVHEHYGQINLGAALFAQREDEEFHIPVDFETAVCAAIEAGDSKQLDLRLQTPSQGRIGVMSANPLQQLKYSFVIFAALITRAAIRGGLPNEIAFSLSDIYCQRADVQRDIPALEQLTYTMAQDFCTRVAEIRKTAIHSQPVRACVDYISKHLHEDLRLDDLARECGLCSRSLSLKFKAELGMGTSTGKSCVRPNIF